MMTDEYIRGMVRGLVEAANSFMSSQEYSYVAAECYEPEGARERVAQRLSLPKELAPMLVFEGTLEDAMLSFLHQRRMGRGEDSVTFASLLENVLGPAQLIEMFVRSSDVNEAVSGYEGFDDFFYHVEDIMLVTFPEVAVLLVLGNDE